MAFLTHVKTIKRQQRTIKWLFVCFELEKFGEIRENLQQCNIFK